MNTIVTGASKGIGKATAEAFAKLGSNLFLCARNQHNLKVLKDQLEERNPSIEVHIFATDLSEKENVYEFARQITSLTEQVNVLINNAGYFKPGEMLKQTDNESEYTMNLNFWSAFYLTKALVPFMRKEAGHIFNICSVASLKAYPKSGIYSTSKYALLGFTKALRQDLSSTHIRVTAVHPGPTWSDSWSGVDLPEDRLMPAHAVADSIVAAHQLPTNTVLEELILRPQLGDLL
ncbi:MAG: SDR family oxidoreductase [Bacteroidota bacterium]